MDAIRRAAPARTDFPQPVSAPPNSADPAADPSFEVIRSARAPDARLFGGNAESARSEETSSVGEIARRSALEAAVDRCLVEARARYVVDGHVVHVAPQFRMSGGFNQGATKAGLDALAGRIGSGAGKIPMDVVGHVLAGRGTPADVARVTRALIDAGKLPPRLDGESDEHRIQRMQWQHGVGIDCAGYVQRTLVAVHGKAAPRLGLKEALNEDLGALDHNPAFRKVALSDAKAGDVITLRDRAPGQPGHTVLVARHDVTDGRAMEWRFPPNDPSSAPFVAAKRLEVFDVDSSWGAGREGEHGGVRRATWVHDPETGRWASFDNAGADLLVLDTPYVGHDVVGAYTVR